MSNTLAPLQPRAPVTLGSDDPEEDLVGLVAAGGCQVLTELRELIRKVHLSFSVPFYCQTERDMGF